jgi:hypothetical protein
MIVVIVVVVVVFLVSGRPPLSSSRLLQRRQTRADRVPPRPVDVAHEHLDRVYPLYADEVRPRVTAPEVAID